MKPVLRLALLFALLGTFGSAVNLLPFSRLGAVFELNRNLGSYYLFGHLAVIPLLLLWIRYRLLSGRSALLFLLLSLLLAVKCLSPMMPFFLPRDVPQTLGFQARFKVLLANIERGNDRAPAELMKIFHEHAPDIVVLIETTPTFLRELGAASMYPYTAEFPEHGHFGLALYSKYPLGADPRTSFGEDVTRAYAGSVEIAGRSIQLVALHPPPPVMDELWLMHRLLTRRVATFLRDSEGEALVLGDLNATPHSNRYDTLVFGARLKNAMQGFGWHRTWNAKKWFVRLPIDHVLYRGALSPSSFEVLSDIGSDHFPVLVEFELR